MGKTAELARAIERLHGCKAKHMESVPVKEVFRGKTVWEGVVEVFSVSGPPKAQRSYAWYHYEDDARKQMRVVAVLGVPPINSAHDAVKASIVGDIKRNRAN